MTISKYSVSRDLALYLSDDYWLSYSNKKTSIFRNQFLNSTQKNKLQFIFYNVSKLLVVLSGKNDCERNRLQTYWDLRFSVQSRYRRAFYVTPNRTFHSEHYLRVENVTMCSVRAYNCVCSTRRTLHEKILFIGVTIRIAHKNRYRVQGI